MKRKIVSFFMLVLISVILLNSCQSADEIKQARYFVNGKNIYEKSCQNCHGSNAEGLADLYPSLQASKYIEQYTSNLACDIRFGLNQMPGNKELTPIEIAYLINYIGNYFDNSIGFYSQEQTIEDLNACQ